MSVTRGTRSLKEWKSGTAPGATEDPHGSVHSDPDIAADEAEGPVQLVSEASGTRGPTSQSRGAASPPPVRPDQRFITMSGEPVPTWRQEPSHAQPAARGDHDMPRGAPRESDRRGHRRGNRDRVVWEYEPSETLLRCLEAFGPFLRFFYNVILVLVVSALMVGLTAFDTLRLTATQPQCPEVATPTVVNISVACENGTPVMVSAEAKKEKQTAAGADSEGECACPELPPPGARFLGIPWGSELTWGGVFATVFSPGNMIAVISAMRFTVPLIK